jgi:Tfp pilus assembly PilM family ATPase
MRIRAIVSRDLPEGAASSAAIEGPELVATVIEDILGELDVRERRCVTAIGATSCALRVLKFPKMSWHERTRAAHFEAQRFAPWDMDQEPSVVRIHTVNRAEQLYAVGVTTRAALESRIAAFKIARLRVEALEHEAFALRRAFPTCDAVLDIGTRHMTLHAFNGQGPLSWSTRSGGEEITRGIARDLDIDMQTAERRKRILGTAGAGGASRDTMVVQARDLIERARSRVAVDRVTLSGNGARLHGFAPALEAVSSTSVELPVSDLLRCDVYPEDVVRVAAPDWTLAAGLAAWGHGA